MERLVVALVIVAVVGVIAVAARRRRVPDVPTQRAYSAPDQLDRADFANPDTPWLVAVFSSASCDACRSVIAKAQVLESTQVAVVDIEYGAAKAVHERYSIDTVPTTVIADAAGVVVASFVGQMTATDLWAAVAEAREPGSTPGSGSCQLTD